MSAGPDAVERKMMFDPYVKELVTGCRVMSGVRATVVVPSEP
jgi:hypothetical protein